MLRWSHWLDASPRRCACCTPVVCNTVLFAGFDGFVSKLWLQHDGEGRYRGIYEWRDALTADQYARALWWPLAVVAGADSIEYAIHPCADRDRFLTGRAPLQYANQPPPWSIAVATTDRGDRRAVRRASAGRTR